jgi:hypothetical protein
VTIDLTSSIFSLFPDEVVERMGSLSIGVGEAMFKVFLFVPHSLLLLSCNGQFNSSISGNSY